MSRFKRYLERNRGVLVQSVITDIPPLSAQSKERLGAIPPKSLALLERIIMASTNEGDVVLYPFCGCGTAVHAAEKLGRQWRGIDITNLAISLIEKRLYDAFPDVAFTVHGVSKDMDGAQALGEKDKYQFRWWAISLVKAIPFGRKKKVQMAVLTGLLYVYPDNKQIENVIVSVKGGQNVGDSAWCVTLDMWWSGKAQLPPVSSAMFKRAEVEDRTHQGKLEF